MSKVISEEINKDNTEIKKGVEFATGLEDVSAELLLKEINKRLNQKEVKILWSRYNENNNTRVCIQTIYCGNKAIMDSVVVEVDLIGRVESYPSSEEIKKQREDNKLNTNSEKLKEFSKDDLEKELERRKQLNKVLEQDGSEEK